MQHTAKFGQKYKKIKIFSAEKAEFLENKQFLAERVKKQHQ